MSLAPNYDVPPDVSPFPPLPLLDSCAHCTGPLDWWEPQRVVVHGRVHGPLCRLCAVAALTAPPPPWWQRMWDRLTGTAR